MGRIARSWDIFKRSWAIFEQTWGESVVGSLGMGLIFFVAMLALFAVVASLVSMKLAIVAAAVGVLRFVALMVVQAALSGIYLASVFRFATTGSVSGGFDRETILAAFREKPAK